MATERTTHQARNGALLFGGASVVTLLGLLLPHEAAVDTLGLTIVAAGSALLAALLAVAGRRLPQAGYGVAIGLGSLLISLAAYSNGERSGGPAGYDELYYLWVVFYAAYYMDRRSLGLQVLLIAAAYGVTLVLVDPGADRDEPLAHRHRARHRRRDRRPPAHRARGAADGRARPCRQHRPPDGARQPAGARGGVSSRGRAGGAHGRVDRDRADRPQSLQGHQRRVRPRGRRRGARRGRRTHAPRACGRWTSPPASAATSSSCCSPAPTPPPRTPWRCGSPRPPRPATTAGCRSGCASASRPPRAVPRAWTS